MKSKMNFYFPLEKFEKQDDGTLVVFGIASSEAVDSQGETIKAEAMSDALPDFFKYGTGNLREMHQPMAAGTIDSATVKDGVTYIEASVIDPVAIKKVEAGVYKGFSIGGRVTSRDEVNKTIITGLKLTEISLVDRPANPEAMFSVFKSEDADNIVAQEAVDALADMLTKGEVSPERLIALAKADAEAQAKEPATEGEQTTTEALPEEPAQLELAEKTGEIKKGMYSISNFARLIQSLAYLQQDTEWEAEYEADGSDIPARIKACIASFVEIFKDMVIEETNELLGVEPDIVAMAEKIKGLEKSGARNNKTDKATIQQMHDNAVTLGADCGTEKADGADDLAKADADILAKFADISERLTKAEEALTAKDERIKALEEQPTVGKAFISALVTKEQDSNFKKADEPTEVRKADGSIDQEATTTLLIKKAQQNPVRMTS